MMTDPIADMLTRIRNASLVHKKEAIIPYSRIKMEIINILVINGYVKSVEQSKDKHPYLVVQLKYDNGQPAITHLKRVSKPGQRQYVKNTEIKSVLSGFGIAILSTPAGLMTDREAAKAKIGGEIICEVY